MLAGVCSGIALRLRVDPTLVRVGAVVLTVITGGVAAIGYGLLWVALPVSGEEPIVRRWKPRQGTPPCWRVSPSTPGWRPPADPAGCNSSAIRSGRSTTHSADGY